MYRHYLYVLGAVLIGAAVWSRLVDNGDSSGPQSVTPSPRQFADRGAVGGEMKRLARAVADLQDEQDALSEDLDDLALVIDEERQVQSPEGDSLEATTAALRAHEEAIVRVLERQPRDTAMESALTQTLSMHEGAGPLDLLGVSCYSDACRLELGGGSAESPISVLMSTPSLGGELLAMPDQDRPDLLVVHVARDHGALPGGV